MNIKKVFSILVMLTVSTTVLVFMTSCGKIPSAFVGDYSGTIEEGVTDIIKWTATVDNDGGFSGRFGYFGKLEASSMGRYHTLTGKIKNIGKFEGELSFIDVGKFVTLPVTGKKEK